MGNKDERALNQNRSMIEEDYLNRNCKKSGRINFNPVKRKKCMDCGSKLYNNTIGGSFCKKCRTWYSTKAY